MIVAIIVLELNKFEQSWSQVSNVEQSETNFNGVEGEKVARVMNNHHQDHRHNLIHGF